MFRVVLVNPFNLFAPNLLDGLYLDIVKLLKCFEKLVFFIYWEQIITFNNNCHLIHILNLMLITSQKNNFAGPNSIKNPNYTSKHPNNSLVHSHSQSQHSQTRYSSHKNLPFSREEFLSQFFDHSGTLKAEYSRITYEDGSEYIGQVTDCKQGKGMYSFPNKDVYMGTWKSDKFHGDGIYMYNNGETYYGKFQDGKKNGKGTYYYKSGARYEGEWQKDRKNGFGIFFYANNDRFEGNWLNN